MRTVSYFTPKSTKERAAIAFLGARFLSRTGWQDARELPRLRRVAFFHPELPEPFNGLRIAQVSDVHAGQFMPPERLARVRNLLRGMEPDLIAFTGDQLDRREVDAEIFVHGFAGIEAPLGVFGVLGNHDHMAGAELSITAMKAIGVVPLVNQAAVIERGDARILLAGVDDLDAELGAGADFSAVSRLSADFRLLLCHQPRGWRRARAAGAHITLAGHTHGGQIAFPSRGLNVATLGTPYVAGPYFRQRKALYVSRGVGVGAVPVRFGSLPEVDLITLWRGPLSAI
jgi:predicted MPP superfamily phosphohydrolase